DGFRSSVKGHPERLKISVVAGGLVVSNPGGFEVSILRDPSDARKMLSGRNDPRFAVSRNDGCRVLPAEVRIGSETTMMLG
ncbi:hypothetical protein NL460_29630, partial [Klebsiella pneumoniae]|nr:hypothetical protein [Klebsiella pneumoniae]